MTAHEFDGPLGGDWKVLSDDFLRAAAVGVKPPDAELLDRIRRFAQTPPATTAGAHSDVIRGFNAGESQTLKRLREILGIEEG